MTHDALFRRFFSLRDLAGLDGKSVAEAADAAERAAIAGAFELLALDAFEVEGVFRREGEEGWRFDGEIRATLAQPCVVTLEPVPARLAEPLERRWRPGAPDPFAPGAASDFAFDDEDPPEPLGDGVDLGAAALETLALALDPYPRAEGAQFAPLSAMPKGAAPLGEEEGRKPFAALAALKKSMGEGD